MDNLAAALGPLDLVKYSDLKELAKPPPLDFIDLESQLQDIIQKAADYINKDWRQEFLYKNPNGWQRITKSPPQVWTSTVAIIEHYTDLKEKGNDNIPPQEGHINNNNFYSSSEESLVSLQPWCVVGNFDFPTAVRQITAFVETWQLTEATKFVVIALEKCEVIEPFGERYYVEVHFSKPTPKCPNPLAVAKVYFHINVSRLLPADYPVNVTYKFEGYRTMFYAMGERKMSANNIQGFLIDTILHMKLSFFAQMNECKEGGTKDHRVLDKCH